MILYKKFNKLFITLLLLLAFPLNAFAIGDFWGEKSIDPDVQEAQQTQSAPEEQSGEIHAGTTPDKALAKEERIIRDIELYGVNALSPEDILAKMTLQKGSAYSRDLVQTDLKAIYQLGYF